MRFAEGVEYEEKKEHWNAHSFDKSQGYLMAKPLDIEAAIDCLNQQTYTILQLNILTTGRSRSH